MRFRLRLTVVLIVLVSVGVAAWVSVASLATPAGVPPAGYYKIRITITGTGKGSVAVVVPNPTDNLHGTGVGAVLSCSSPQQVCDTTPIMALINSTLTATPEPGTLFTSWAGCDASQATSCTVTHFSGETAPITVTFTAIAPAAGGPAMGGVVRAPLHVSGPPGKATSFDVWSGFWGLEIFNSFFPGFLDNELEIRPGVGDGQLRLRPRGDGVWVGSGKIFGLNKKVAELELFDLLESVYRPPRVTTNFLRFFWSR
jgi:hypothetical protein